MSIEDGAKKFSTGLLDHYEPTLKKLQADINELILKQNSTINEIESENIKFKNVNSSELIDLFLVIKDYQIRLMDLKKEMSSLTDRSARLKKKALKIQEFKQKEALENAHYREAQLKREQDLIVKTKNRPSTSSSNQ